MSALADPETRRKLWSREEVYFLLRAGLLGEKPFELLEGEILYKMPKNPAHVTAVRRCTRWAETTFGAAFVRVQDPLILDLFTEPEPDVLVTVGPEDDYTELHPTASEARLVIEVSDSTLSDDLKEKVVLYARADVVEYWVLDLEHRCLYVHTQPQEREYAQVLRLTEAQRIGSFDVRVSELLP
jgi:Uma2 family endonuclease